MLKILLYFIAFFAGAYILICLLAFLLQDKLIFFPQKLSSDHVFRFEIPFEELYFKMPDDAVVHALLFKADEPRGLVIYFHGNAGSLDSWGYVASDFTAEGYDALVVDYRNYGKSTGKISEKALLDDGQFIYEKMKKNYSEENIMLYGRSLGTGIAAYVAMRNNPGKLILETPYYDFVSLVNAHYGWLPNRLLLRYRFPLNEWLQKTKCPVYLFHGTDDNIIPYEHSERLANEIEKVEALFTIHNGTHNDLPSFPEYRVRLAEILNR